MINIIDIQNDIDNFINKYINNNNYDNFIKNSEDILSTYISENYLHKNKIYGYSVKSEYINIEIVILENKNSELINFKLTKFERLQKLKKLKFLND